MGPNEHHNTLQTDLRYKYFENEKDNDSQIILNESTIKPEMQSNEGGNKIGVVNNSSMVGIPPKAPKFVRLRAMESEREYFLKRMNVSLFRKLVLIQAVASISIVISQVVLYAIVHRLDYKVVDYVGIGLWGPLVFFFTACYLTWMTTRSPSGCSIGTAMAFQIASIFVGIILLSFAAFSLGEHGQAYYDPEIPGRILCSFMILAAVCVTAVGVMTSIQFCGVTCCSRRANTHETFTFDVVTLKA